MQIVIIGAGIAGLSSYIFLTKHLLKDDPQAHSIKIFESHSIHDSHDEDSTDEDTDKLKAPTNSGIRTIGAAIGIGKNGLAVLGRIDDDGELLDEVKRRGNCVSKWEMGTARGWKLVNASVESSPEKDARGEGQHTVMIARQVAWSILRDKVLSIDPNAVTQAKVAEVVPLSDGRVNVKFEDGSECTADLVIGADGLRSVVRKKIFENTTDTKSQGWWEGLLRRRPITKDYISPHYEGLTGMGGFVPSSVLKQAGYENCAMSITFGPNGFFGHGYMGPIDTTTRRPKEDTTSDTGEDEEQLAAWWSTFSSTDPYPFQDLTSGTTTTKPKLTINQPLALRNLNLRHSTWKDPVIRAIVSHVTTHNLVENMYPTYTTPELPTWHNTTHNLVLIGDAAHALQPSSGQGACQALEDSEALSLLLSRHLSTPADPNRSDRNTPAILRDALTQFVTLRKPRLSQIYTQSQKFGKMKADMGIVQEMLMYFFIWLSNRLGMWKGFNDGIFEYDLPGEVERLMRRGG